MLYLDSGEEGFNPARIGSLHETQREECNGNSRFFNLVLKRFTFSLIAQSARAGFHNHVFPL